MFAEGTFPAHLFMFSLYLLSSSGSFGGGQTLTVTGMGFDPWNSTILVCNSECAVDKLRSNSTTLFCVIPPNNGKYSKKKKKVTCEKC